MADLVFEVAGSTGAVYEIRLTRAQNKLLFLCTCDAGQNGMHCRHRLELINGKSEALLSRNLSDIPILIGAIENSPISSAIKDVALAERELDLAKKKVSLSKKKLAGAMLGR